jgi:hypothetical protein
MKAAKCNNVKSFIKDLECLSQMRADKNNKMFADEYSGVQHWDTTPMLDTSQRFAHEIDCSESAAYLTGRGAVSHRRSGNDTSVFIMAFIRFHLR